MSRIARDTLPRTFRYCTVVVFVLAAQLTLAQEGDPFPEKRAAAVRIADSRMRVDGLLTEPEWELAAPATRFIQQEPSEGADSTEAADIRFLYDDQQLYVGARLYQDPSRLVVNELKQDFAPREGDMFCLVLDTFRDRLTGYSLCVEPSAARRESQIADDGRGNNVNWDAVWHVKTSVDDKGWIVEMAVPFRSLRFPESDEQEWGLNLARVIRWKNETASWSFIPRAFGLSKVSYSGVLDGIRGVRPGRNIRVKPFGTLRGRQSTATDADADGGVDVKVGLGSNFVVDGTYRTDFAQVEADEQQINLTRFSLFFPEKREFFLENQAAFEIGPTQGRTNFVPFFSRRIGLTDAGQPIPLIGGARLSGKKGRGTTAVLNIQTEREQTSDGQTLPASNFSVGRYSHEFLSNSSASVFYLGHERGPAFNRVVGSELELKIRRQLNIDAFLMRSHDAVAGEGTAWRAGFDYASSSTRYGASYTSLADTFRDDLGFIPRLGVDIMTASAGHTFRPARRDRLVREYGPSMAYTRFQKEGVGAETETTVPSFTVEFADSSTARVTYQQTREALLVPFAIRPGHAIPPGRYEFGDVSADFSTSRSHRLSLSGGYQAGEFWDGTRRGVTAGGRVRMNVHLATSLSYSRDVVDLRGFSFDTNLLVWRIDGSFTTRSFLNAFFQYNSLNREVVSNVRFHYIYRPLSDIFVVYNDSRLSRAAQPASRSVVVKLSRMLSF